MTRRDCRTIERYEESEGREAVRYGIRRACYAYGVTPLLRSRPAPGRGLPLRRCDSASGAPDPPSHSVPTGCRLSRRGDFRNASRPRAAGGIRATDGRCEIRSPRTAGRGTRTCNIEDPSRETVTRYPSTPVLARYCHLPYTLSRRGVHRKDETHTARCLKTLTSHPTLSPHSTDTHLSDLTVCPWGYRQPTYAPRLCTQDHWIWYRHPPTMDSPRT